MVHDDQDIVATFAVILVQANTSAGRLFMSRLVPHKACEDR